MSASTSAARSAKAPLAGRRGPNYKGVHHLEGWKVVLFMLPAGCLIAGVMLYPMMATIALSFQRVRGMRPAGEFVGLANYLNLMARPEVWDVTFRTFVWTIGVVSGTTLFALMLALVLNQPFHGRRWVRAIAMLPWATSLALSAVVWKFALDQNIGLVNHTLKLLGLIQESIAWLATAIPAFPVMIAVGIWVSVSFTGIMILSAIQSIPHDLFEAARIEGASYWQQTVRVTLPSIRRMIAIVTMANFIVVFNSFPIIYIMTGGGPMQTTDILVTYLYREAFRFLEFGVASALGVFVLGVLAIFTLIYLRLLLGDEEAH